MSRFKVGDRVRARVSDGTITAGDIGVVAEDCSIPFVDWVCGKRWAYIDDELELVRAADWQPKVGDRVRMVKEVDGHKADCGATVVRHDGGEYLPVYIMFDDHQEWACDNKWWVGADDIEPLPTAAPVAAQAQPEAPAEQWAPKVGDRVKLTYSSHWDGEGVVESVGGYIRVKMATGNAAGQTGSFGREHLALVPPFRISAGKFYKTRDGRKVGPMRRGSGGNWPFYHDEYGYHAVSAEGKSCINSDEDDLIAEWLAAPAAVATTVNTAATVDYQADEYGSGVVGAPAGSKPKFKVGDKVRCTAGTGDATVVEVRADGKCKVRWGNGSGARFWWGDKDFDLISSATTSAIVALIEDGKPKPNSRPYVHSTMESANTEAARLASLHKGKKFGVYVLTGEPAFVERPTYKHAWQTEAANGNKIAAIKELRAVADVGLWAAKTAVEDWVSRQARAA